MLEEASELPSARTFPPLRRSLLPLSSATRVFPCLPFFRDLPGLGAEPFSPAEKSTLGGRGGEGSFVLIGRVAGEEGRGEGVYAYEKMAPSCLCLAEGFPSG